jgi:hypothetical protein
MENAMINYNPKLTDADMIAALVDYVRKGGAVYRAVTPKAKTVKRDPNGRIIMSRVAAKPVTSKVTQGYALKALKDTGFTK